MKRLIASVSIALLAVSAGPAVAKDWTTLRFGTERPAAGRNANRKRAVT